MTGRVTRWAFLDHPGPIPFAHRGGASDHPENTMSAFGHAVALGYRYVETDVHTTADGALVAFHDHLLDRVTDRRGVIATLPWEQVRAARISGEPIPLLEDILGAWPDLRVNVDPKSDASLEPLLEALRRTGAHDRVCVGSFSEARLQRFRRLAEGKVCTGMGVRAIARLRAASMGMPTRRFGGDCAQVPVRHGRIGLVDRRFLAAAHRRSLPVHVWTIDDAAEMDRLLDLGVDGIMTDCPALLKEVLIRRGQWS